MYHHVSTTPSWLISSNLAIPFGTTTGTGVRVFPHEVLRNARKLRLLFRQGGLLDPNESPGGHQTWLGNPWNLTAIFQNYMEDFPELPRFDFQRLALYYCQIITTDHHKIILNYDIYIVMIPNHIIAINVWCYYWHMCLLIVLIMG